MASAHSCMFVCVPLELFLAWSTALFDGGPRHDLTQEILHTLSSQHYAPITPYELLEVQLACIHYVGQTVRGREIWVGGGGGGNKYLLLHYPYWSK